MFVGDSFKKQAIEYVKEAIKEDKLGNYGKAFPLYMNALEYFKTHLKYESDPRVKEAICGKFTEYLRRAEEIRMVLDYNSAPTSSSAPARDGGDLAADEEEEKLRDALRSAIVKDKVNVKWGDVAGLVRVKQALQEAVILPVKFPQFFTGKRKPWKAFLLYGPSGTGKSYLAKAVATESSSTFFSISASDLGSKWMGQSEKLISNIFQMAKENSPSIVFIDKIESLFRNQREDDDSDALRRIKTQLLAQLQEIEQNDDRIFVLAATNAPFDLDQAIRRRFDKRIYVPLPDMEARIHLFKIHLGDTPHNITDTDFESSARRTEGFSGLDISICVQEAIFSSKMKDKNPPLVTESDIDEVLSRKRPTVSKSDIDVHERFTREFGEEG